MLNALTTKPIKWPLKAGAVFGAAVLGYLTIVPVGPNKFGLKQTFHTATQTDLPPGIYIKLPLVQTLYAYTKTPQTIEYTAGGCRTMTCDTTADHASLYAKIRLQYTVLPNHTGLAMRPFSMYGMALPDGWWEITDQLNATGSAVMGRRTLQANMTDYDKVATELLADLKDRLAQNNTPIRIDTFEFLGFRTIFPTGTTLYKNVPTTP